MKTTLLLVSLTALLVVLATAPATITYTATPVYASTTPFISPEVLRDAPLSTTTISIMVLATQKKYGLDSFFYRTMECESEGFQDIQSEVPKKGSPNGRENSWGIPQINLDYHPEITRTEALDVAWALDWAGNEFAHGRASEWTCYRILKATPAS